MSLPLSIPMWVAKCMAKVGDGLGKKAPINSLKLTKLTRTSVYSNAKIRAALGWKPLNIVENFKITE